jgi:hypothetical protein
MSKNLVSPLGDLSPGQLPASGHKTNLGNKRGSFAAAVADDGFGGVAYSAWNNTETSPISEFEVSWTVPPSPQQDGEEYYIYNSLVWAASDGNGKPACANLRPVLRWAVPETGGSPCWTISSWYIGQNSTSATTPVPVTADDRITGKIALTRNDPGSEYDYKCFFTKYDTATLSDVEVPGTQMYVYGGVAYTTAIVGFEWQNVKTKADFFSTATTAIVAGNIVIKTVTTNPTVAWKLSTFQTTGDGGPVAVQVDSTSSTAGKIQFNLPS